MTPTINTDDLLDAQGVAVLLGLRHANSVHTYLRRYADMPRPVLDLGPGPAPAVAAAPDPGVGGRVGARRWRREPGHRAQGQRPVLVRQRPQVQALPQGHRGPRSSPGGSARCGRCRPRSPGPTTPRPASPGRWAEPMVKSPDVIARMRVAGRVAAEVLAETGAAVRPGITTDELDAICHEACIRRGAYPSPLNYHGLPQVAVHLGQRGHLPRHPRRPAAGRRRHRQPRRHRLPRRGARRHQRHLPGRRGRRGVADAGQGDRASASTSGSPPSCPGRPISDIGQAIESPRRPPPLRRGADVRRPRDRRAVPHRAERAPLLHRRRRPP